MAPAVRQRRTISALVGGTAFGALQGLATPRTVRIVGFDPALVEPSIDAIERSHCLGQLHPA